MADGNSFTNLDVWIREIKSYSYFVNSSKAEKNAVIYLIGNKCDMEEERQVDSETARSFAELHGFQYFETSAKTGSKIDDVFLSIAEEIKTKNDYSTIKSSEKVHSDRYNELLKIDTNTYADSYENSVTKKKG